jgi:hypothetical protein
LAPGRSRTDARHANDLRSFGPPSTPVTVPWPHPQWTFDPRRRALFYPDLDDQPEEVLSSLASLLGSQDLEWVQSIVVRQAPAVMAHELVHHWRDIAGRLTTDFWYEELAANRLTAADVTHFRPELAEVTREIMVHALSAHPEGLPPQSKETLDRVLAPDRRPEEVAPGHDVTLHEMALIQLAMITRLLDKDPPLEAIIAELLPPARQVSEFGLSRDHLAERGERVKRPTASPNSGPTNDGSRLKGKITCQ